MLTLHFLEQSRAFRILWLLELLELPYQLKIYSRQPQSLLAPDELKQIHPLGKSPLLQDGELTLAESAIITDYLIQTYGNGKFMPERQSPLYWDYQRWLHYAEASLMPLMLLSLVFYKIDSSPMPFFAKPIANKITARVKNSFIQPQLALHLAHVEQQLQGKNWLLGESISGADIMMSYPLQAAGSRLSLAEYPNINAYLNRIEREPSYLRALEKGGAPILKIDS